MPILDELRAELLRYLLDRTGLDPWVVIRSALGPAASENIEDENAEDIFAGEPRDAKRRKTRPQADNPFVAPDADEASADLIAHAILGDEPQADPFRDPENDPAPAGPPRRSGRKRRPARGEPSFFLRDPIWERREDTPATGRLGGLGMEAILGIGADSPTENVGSQTTHGPSIMDLLKDDEAETWISGHLLNAQLGGAGYSYNETPLRSAANSRHKTYEKKLKDSITILRQVLERSGHLELQNTVGFRYVVKVLDDVQTTITIDGEERSIVLPGGVSGSIEMVNLDKSLISDAALRSLWMSKDTGEYKFQGISGGLENIFNLQVDPFEAAN